MCRRHRCCFHTPNWLDEDEWQPMVVCCICQKEPCSKALSGRRRR